MDHVTSHVGTAICGASAIGAVSGVVVARESEIAYAVSTSLIVPIALAEKDSLGRPLYRWAPDGDLL